MPQIAKACDACRIRRTKCSGSHPCERCAVSGIECTFAVPRRKRGPAGKTVTRLRSAAPSSPSRIPKGENGFRFQLSPTIANVDSPFGQSFHAKSSFLHLIDSLLSDCLADYFRYVYDLCPVVDVESVKSRFKHKHHLHDKPFAALLLSLTTLPLYLPTAPSGSQIRADDLLAEAITMHHNADLGTDPTLEAVATSISLGAALRVRKGFNSAYVRMREAGSLIELLNLKNMETHQKFTKAERQVAVSIYWLLASAERSNSLLLCRPISVRGSLSYLAALIDPDQQQCLRLHSCTRLFEVMDENLVDCMNWTCNRPHCGFTALTAQLTSACLDAIEPDANLSPVQLADFLLTKQWLRAKVWQACVMHECVDDDNDFSGTSMNYPLLLLEITTGILDGLPSAAIIGNGQAMGAKLNALCEAVESVLNLPITPTMPTSILSIEHASQLLERIRSTAQSSISQPWIRWEGSEQYV